MKPDKDGIWEWFEEDGTKRLVHVCDVAGKLMEEFGQKYLRVCWWGGYYNVNDEHDPEAPEHDHLLEAEWPDKWGNYVGPIGSVAETDLYLMPTPEQREQILKTYKLKQL